KATLLHPHYPTPPPRADALRPFAPRIAVPESCRCACCSGQLEPAQELRFLVETANLDNPSYLSRIRRLPAIKGRPVPVCATCQARMETYPLRPCRARPKPNVIHTGVLAAIGLLSVGWLVQNVLFGPRA